MIRLLLLGGPDEVNCDCDGHRIIVMLLNILRFQQGTSRFSGVVALDDISQSHQALESASLLHIVVRRIGLVGIQICLQFETRRWQGDGGANGLHCADVLHKFFLECGFGLILMLFVSKTFADGVEDLKEWDFVVTDATVYLAECAENPLDIILACTVIFHLPKLFGDR